MIDSHHKAIMGIIFFSIIISCLFIFSESEIVSQTFVTQYLEIEDNKFIEAKKGLKMHHINTHVHMYCT